MWDRILILGTQSASLFEPGPHAEKALRIDYYDGYVKLGRLVADGITPVFCSERSEPPVFRADVDLESLNVLEPDQAQLRIRKSYLAALHQRHRKAQKRLTSRRGHGNGGGFADAGGFGGFGGFGGGGGGDGGGGGGGGAD